MGKEHKWNPEALQNLQVCYDTVPRDIVTSLNTVRMHENHILSAILLGTCEKAIGL